VMTLTVLSSKNARPPRPWKACWLGVIVWYVCDW
jgi:hypothetical protein